MDNIPYYVFDEDDESRLMSQNGEAYIDDEELRALLIDLLGDNVPEEEIQKILKAASDENISDEDFDKLVDDFILKNKS
ncbi:MAG: hypothetical protein IJL02_09210 [Methanobrevibacter sp.]|uniref:hypothetical protein n=1 Tax=Methanobrevibacter sp. TaxID=66852 RepID=UPI0025E17E1F|nr:hypothetical protein [Methanobrevibacter sp.]MBQ6100018.1 hypothetical protein [Methanobrevibacter sp.]